MRRYAVCMVVLVAALSGSALASAGTASAATVELRETAIGPILTNSSGFVLFEFSIDKKKTEQCVTIPNCTTVWPPLEVTSAPTAGEGVNANLLGTITLPGGGMQVTYAGHELYMYSEEEAPLETPYVGVSEFGGTWYALNSAGKKVKQPKKKKK